LTQNPITLLRVGAWSNRHRKVGQAAYRPHKVNDLLWVGPTPYIGGDFYEYVQDSRRLVHRKRLDDQVTRFQALSELCGIENHLAEVHASEVRAGQVRAGQVRAGQVRAGQVRVGQVRIGQVRAGKVRAGQIRDVVSSRPAALR